MQLTKRLNHAIDVAGSVGEARRVMPDEVTEVAAGDNIEIRHPAYAHMAEMVHVKQRTS
jgi:hypothetical protein